MKPAPDVPAAEIEWRPQGRPMEGRGGTRCQWIGYVSAPIVARLLDEWVGPEGWRDEYEPTVVAQSEAMWCRLSIRDPESGEWVTKVDIGTPSDMEGTKGVVSDAFKRAACLKWGVARNVYDVPALWATCDTYTSNGKVHPKANANTTGELLAQLRKFGITDSDVRVSEAPPEVDTPAPVEPVATSATADPDETTYLRTVAEQQGWPEGKVLAAARKVAKSLGIEQPTSFEAIHGTQLVELTIDRLSGDQP